MFAITTRQDSTLAAVDLVVAIPTARSDQFGGSLFEQASMILLDALVIDVTAGHPDAHTAMAGRHSNLE